MIGWAAAFLFLSGAMCVCCIDHIAAGEPGAAMFTAFACVANLFGGLSEYRDVCECRAHSNITGEKA